MALIRYTVIRFFGLIISLFVILSIVFFATRFAQLKHWSFPLDFPEQIEFVKNEYIRFIQNVFTRWDWGSSDGVPVWDLLKDTAPITLKLNLIAFAIYFTFGITLGFLTAFKAHTWFDKIMSFPVLVLGSIPSFIWIFLFIILFGYTLGWLPPRPPSVEEPMYWRLAGWVMPVGALVLAPLAKFTGMMRNELVDNFDADYLLLLRTKGLSRRQTMLRHSIRDSFVPIMPEIVPTFVFVMVGSFFVEMIYNMKGVSTLLFDAMFHPMIDFYYISIDTPMVVMICAFYATITLLFTFLVDVMYAVVDPRIRIGVRK